MSTFDIPRTRDTYGTTSTGLTSNEVSPGGAIRTTVEMYGVPPLITARTELLAALWEPTPLRTNGGRLWQNVGLLPVTQAGPLFGVSSTLEK